jgi:predicted dehydrogenase
MQFHGHVTRGEEDSTTVTGTQGTLRSRGTGLNKHPEVELFLEAGQAVAPLNGCWFDNGFKGTMAELLCAIDEDREPYNSAASNLVGLELCFAALKSADSGQPVEL